MKKLVLILTATFGLSAFASDYTTQLSKLLNVSGEDIYNVTTLVKVPAIGSTPALTTVEFSYDVEEFDAVFGLEVLTYNCVATAAADVFTPEMINCELDEGILFDEF